jgi:hypothetical protein
VRSCCSIKIYLFYMRKKIYSFFPKIACEHKMSTYTCKKLFLFFYTLNVFSHTKFICRVGFPPIYLSFLSLEYKVEDVKRRAIRIGIGLGGNPNVRHVTVRLGTRFGRPESLSSNSWINRWSSSASAMDDDAMAARPSKRTRTSTPARGWSNLSSEIGGVILSRMPSLADRARFCCVCRQWRHAAKQQRRILPPAPASASPSTSTRAPGKPSTGGSSAAPAPATSSLGTHCCRRRPAWCSRPLG